MQHLLIAVALAAPFAVVARANDVVTYVQNGKEEKAKDGFISAETPAKVTYRVGTKTQDIPAADVTDVEYDPRGKVDKVSLNNANFLVRKSQDATKPEERRQNLTDAVAAYHALLKPSEEL